MDSKVSSNNILSLHFKPSTLSFCTFCWIMLSQLTFVNEFLWDTWGNTSKWIMLGWNVYVLLQHSIFYFFLHCLSISCGTLRVCLHLPCSVLFYGFQFKWINVKCTNKSVNRLLGVERAMSVVIKQNKLSLKFTLGNSLMQAHGMLLSSLLLNIKLRPSSWLLIHTLPTMSLQKGSQIAIGNAKHTWEC